MGFCDWQEWLKGCYLVAGWQRSAVCKRCYDWREHEHPEPEGGWRGWGGGRGRGGSQGREAWPQADHLHPHQPGQPHQAGRRRRKGRPQVSFLTSFAAVTFKYGWHHQVEKSDLGSSKTLLSGLKKTGYFLYTVITWKVEVIKFATVLANALIVLNIAPFFLHVFLNFDSAWKQFRFNRVRRIWILIQPIGTDPHQNPQHVLYSLSVRVCGIGTLTHFIFFSCPICRLIRIVRLKYNLSCCTGTTKSSPPSL
jgi:hypothetical protein